MRLTRNAPYSPMLRKCLHSNFLLPAKILKLNFSIRSVTKEVKDKIMPANSHSNIFGQLALLMQTRDIELREVFKYPVGPYNWFLCGPMGELRKMSKASLLNLIEKDVNTEEFVEGETVTVLDGTQIVLALGKN